MLEIPFVVRPAAADETARPGEGPDAYLERVAAAKLAAARAAGASDTGGILVADTIVVAPGGAILGKPAGEDDARAMIERLAGVTHAVSTRFLLGDAAPDAAPRHAQTVTTHVTFRALSPSEIDAYVRTGEGRDKAGGYAVQGRASAFVEQIEGSYTSVVGLPLSQVAVALRAIGWV